jgi:hypothetical protein
MVAGQRAGARASTAKLALIALSQVFRHAVRRRWIGVNPVMQLEPGEKPRGRQQLSRQRMPKHLKADVARREVVRAPAVTRLLRERWLTSACKGAEQLVFCKDNGEGGEYRDAGKAFRAAVRRLACRARAGSRSYSLRHATRCATPSPRS